MTCSIIIYYLYFVYCLIFVTVISTQTNISHTPIFVPFPTR